MMRTVLLAAALASVSAALLASVAAPAAAAGQSVTVRQPGRSVH